MTGPSFLGEEQADRLVATARANSAECDQRWQWYRGEYRWLHDRIQELERRLRLRSSVLAGALMLNAFLAGFMVFSFYRPELPKVELEAAWHSDTLRGAPSATWKVEQNSQIERSPAVAIGEAWIETIATLQFDAQRTQAATEELAVTWRDAGAETMKASAKESIPAKGSEAVGRACSPASLEAAVSTLLGEEAGRAARADGRIHYTATDFVNLRAAPSNSADVLTVVKRGGLVRRTGQGLGWLQVEYSDGSVSDIRGWVYSTHLRKVERSVRPARP